MQALNVAARAEPAKHFPFNARYIYSPQGSVGVGPRGPPVEIWRGYFMSIRPAMGRMVVNVDVSCGVFYRPGSLIDLISQFLGIQPAQLAGLPTAKPREFRKAQRFVSGLRVQTLTVTGQTIMRSIRKLDERSANNVRFTPREGASTTVTAYFQAHNARLQHPNLWGVEVC